MDHRYLMADVGVLRMRNRNTRQGKKQRATDSHSYPPKFLQLNSKLDTTRERDMQGTPRTFSFGVSEMGLEMMFPPREPFNCFCGSGTEHRETPSHEPEKRFLDEHEPFQ
jgi:hypothetical protein